MLEYLPSFSEILKYLFRKRTIVFQGMAGVVCCLNKEKYFVDTEMLFGPGASIFIYSNYIYLMRKGEKYEVDQTTKEKVLAFLIQELDRQKIKYDL